MTPDWLVLLAVLSFASLPIVALRVLNLTSLVLFRAELSELQLFVTREILTDSQLEMGDTHFHVQ